MWRHNSRSQKNMHSKPKMSNSHRYTKAGNSNEVAVKWWRNWYWQVSPDFWLISFKKFREIIWQLKNYHGSIYLTNFCFINSYNYLFFDSFTEGDTVALRESLAQLSGASSPAESVVSTSSNPSATSSIRGGRREKARRGKKKGHSGSSKSASRGSTPPLLADWMMIL